MCKETMSSVPADTKIVELIKKREEGSKPFVSIEFFPPRTEVGVKVSCHAESPGEKLHEWLTLSFRISMLEWIA